MLSLLDDEITRLRSRRAELERALVKIDAALLVLTDSVDPVVAPDPEGDASPASPDAVPDVVMTPVLVSAPEASTSAELSRPEGEAHRVDETPATAPRKEGSRRQTVGPWDYVALLRRHRELEASGKRVGIIAEIIAIETGRSTVAVREALKRARRKGITVPESPRSQETPVVASMLAEDRVLHPEKRERRPNPLTPDPAETPRPAITVVEDLDDEPIVPATTRAGVIPFDGAELVCLDCRIGFRSKIDLSTHTLQEHGRHPTRAEDGRSPRDLAAEAM